MTGGSTWTPLAPVERVRASIERRVLGPLASGRRWDVTTAFAALAIGVLLAGFLPDVLSRDSPQWTFIIDHSRGDLFDPAVGSASRDANLTFRIVPRLLGKALQFDRPWMFFTMQVVAGFVALIALVRLLDEALRDRRAAVLATIGTVGLWAVACAWVEGRGNFDGLAITLLLLAMRSRRATIVALAGLAATFTDERALFVLPMVVAWHLVRDDPAGGVGRRPAADALRQVPWLPAAAAASGAVLHVAIREALKARYGLSEGTNHAPGNPWAQLNNYPNGIWGALEGYWLVALAGLAGLWRGGRRWVVTGIVLSLLVTLLVGLSVFDISRSVMYVFPILPVAAVGLRGLPRRWVRGLLWIAASVTLAWPLLYAADEGTVNWSYPLPMLLVDHYLLP